MLLAAAAALLPCDKAQARDLTKRRPYPVPPPAQPIESKKVRLDLCYSGSGHHGSTVTKLIVEIPQTIQGRQKILNIDYSIKPERVFRENGTAYAEFMFEKPKSHLALTISIEAQLYRYDLSVARQKAGRNTDKPTDLDDFLKQETGIEKDDPRIQQVARTLKGKTETETVRKIFDYVTDTMEYSIDSNNTGALLSLAKKKGDCSEYSDLFVALCRAANIPARFITGYSERYDGISPKHHWVEVYFQDYGWVPFDPSWGDVENPAAKNLVFERLQPIYLYLGHLRNDPVLYNSHFYAYLFYGQKVDIEDSVLFTKTAASSYPGNLSAGR